MENGIQIFASWWSCAKHDLFDENKGQRFRVTRTRRTDNVLLSWCSLRLSPQISVAVILTYRGNYAYRLVISNLVASAFLDCRLGRANPLFRPVYVGCTGPASSCRRLIRPCVGENERCAIREPSTNRRICPFECIKASQILKHERHVIHDTADCKGSIYDNWSLVVVLLPRHTYT
jgi:hypothetical protein